MISEIYGLVMPPPDGPDLFLIKLIVVSEQFIEFPNAHTILDITVRLDADVPSLRMNASEFFSIRILYNGSRDVSSYFPYRSSEWTGVFRTSITEDGSEQLVVVATGTFHLSRDLVIAARKSRSAGEVRFIE